ncbi:alpha/beta hydrolase [Saccharothrix lopnurensis]|uniref:Alpha/beta hydrolase n=1 Tax=Saccharothrix lopnurensis TaxID=1670621 RepID=A0ABW1PDD1_9PSEU
MRYSTQVERVVFRSGGDLLVGDLHRPVGADPGAAVVVAGSWTTVKEQMAGGYARGLAARGLAALAFDFRGFGESGGEPRDLESPERKVEDLREAVGALVASTGSDAVGLLGVCAGAGYTAVAAAEDERVRSLALVAPWLHDEGLVEAVYGADGVRARIRAGEEAAREHGRTGRTAYVPVVSETGEAAAMHGRCDYYVDADRGAVPEWPNRFAVMAWPGWLRFDPISWASRITVPVLVVHSDDAAIPEGVRKFRAGLSGPSELRWLSGTQYDFYDREPVFTEALNAVADHFRDVPSRIL